MKPIMANWRRVLLEEKQKDTKKVAKIVIYNNENKVLFLKRTNYLKKHAGEWDLPGGHAHEDEKLEKAARREVLEETGLSLGRLEKIKEQGNTTYFKSKYVDGEIKLSKEHSEFLFRSIRDIKNPDKYEKIAIEVVEKLEND
tara:strand:+ start:1132 stop:1557 length:426 start_codon:yes stop_codon:yes gene_type:complete